MTTRRLALAGLLMSGMALGACATTPLYKPQTSSVSSGYSEQQLDQNQYRVTFAGKRSTSRNRVEDGLVLRAAEVTLGAGYSHFLIDDRDVSRESDGLYRDPWGYDYGPRFAFSYGFGYGRRGFYDPFYYRWGYADDLDRSRYVASADIALLRPEEAASQPKAIDAAAVIANLGPVFATPPSRP
ncbi:MAG: hypothetical protein QM698_13585 [Micropepsaceae bacterium]